MPKLVDHQARRRQLAEAVWRVVATEGIAEVSIRSVAAEAGWSSGALRHYFTNRAEMLAFACEHVIEQVAMRIANLRHTGTALETIREKLLQTMPVDAARHTEASIAFSFLVLGLNDARLAEVQRTHFNAMHELCRRLVETLDEEGLLAPRTSRETVTRRLHALVDGLSVHRLAGHISAKEMTDRLDAYLAEITR